MRYLTSGIFIICWALNLAAQVGNKPVIGKVSYISSQNVYVKFESTKSINIGDTLYLQNENKPIPVLIVNSLSSTSCVCTPISKNTITVSMQISAKTSTPKLNEDKISEKIIPSVEKVVADTLESAKEDKLIDPKFKQKISGSIAASSYSIFSNVSDANSTRHRYQLSLIAKNIGNSKFSAETYASFQHKKDNWDLVQENIFNALKVYSLSVKYDNIKNTQIVLGRKVNPKISSIGAIDGIQYEGKVGGIFFGTFGGFRPNYTDYSFDFSLPQFGVYAGHSFSNPNGEMQNSIAFIEQMNGSKTDRRFAYFQHSNALLKNLYFFGTLEIELYKNINDNPQSTFDISNAYLVLSYQLSKRIRLSTSYDNRKNVIYYESYKSYINQILEIEARQGLSLQTSYCNLKNLTFGMKAGYRFANNNSSETKNLYGYITYNNIPAIKLNVTGAFNYIEASYVKGNIYNLNLSRDIQQVNLFVDIGYQLVDYSYAGSETNAIQNILNLSVSLRLPKKISISANYEYTYEKQDQFSRLNLQIRKRF